MPCLRSYQVKSHRLGSKPVATRLPSLPGNMGLDVRSASAVSTFVLPLRRCCKPLLGVEPRQARLEDSPSNPLPRAQKEPPTWRLHGPTCTVAVELDVLDPLRITARIIAKELLQGREATGHHQIGIDRITNSAFMLSSQVHCQKIIRRDSRKN